MVRVTYNLSKLIPDVTKREYDGLHKSTHVKAMGKDIQGKEREYEMFIVPVRSDEDENLSGKERWYESDFEEVSVTINGTCGLDTQTCRNTVEFLGLLKEWQITTPISHEIKLCENPEEKENYENEWAKAERKLFDEIITGATLDGIVIKEFCTEFGTVTFLDREKELKGRIITWRTPEDNTYITEMAVEYEVYDYRDYHRSGTTVSSYEELKKYFRGLHGEISYFWYYEDYDFYFCHKNDCYVGQDVVDAIAEDDKDVTVIKDDGLWDQVLNLYKAVRDVRGDADKEKVLEIASELYKGMMEGEVPGKYHDIFEVFTDM